MYIPVLGSFPNSKVKLNQAENIETAPRWTLANWNGEVSPISGMMIYDMQINMVKDSNMFDSVLKFSYNNIMTF